MEVTTLDNAEHRKLTLLSLGDRQCGKTTVLDKYCLGIVGFQRVWSTQGVDVHAKMLHCHRGLIMAEIFDFAGELEDSQVGDLIVRLISAKKVKPPSQSEQTKQKSERVDFELRPHIGALPFHGILFWFDLSNKHSFESIPRWAVWIRDRLSEVCRSLYSNEPKTLSDLPKLIGDIPIFFIGNKIDKLKDKLAGKTAEVSMADVRRYHSLLAQFRRNLEKLTKQQVGHNLMFTSKVEEISRLDDIILNLYNLNCRQNRTQTFLFLLETIPLHSLAGPDPALTRGHNSVLPAFKREIQKQTTRVIKAIWRQNSRASPDRARSQSVTRKVEFAAADTDGSSGVQGSDEHTPLRPPPICVVGETHSPTQDRETNSPTLRQRTKTRSKSMFRDTVPEST